MTLQTDTSSSRPGARRARTHRGSETRRRVAAAAAGLFTERGYEGTSMRAIADAAGVHPQTVYLAFGTKSAVLAEAAASLATGDREGASGAKRTRDPARRLQLYARYQREVAARLGPLLALVVAAAYRDPDVAAFREQHQADGLSTARSLVTELEACGALRRGIGTEEAADIIYTLSSPDSYLRLVGDRGWSPERYERWLAELLCDRLLRPERNPGKGRRGPGC